MKSLSFEILLFLYGFKIYFYACFTNDFYIYYSPTEEILLRKSRNLTFRELSEAKDNDSELHEEFWVKYCNICNRLSKKKSCFQKWAG